MKTDKNIQETTEKAFYETPSLVELSLISNDWVIVQGGSIEHDLEEEEGDDLG